MNLKLSRNMFRSDGIFGQIVSDDCQFSCITLEHAYDNGVGGFEPKLAKGKYNCTRYASPHFGFDVFIVNGVPDFQGEKVEYIEIHPGNYNENSHGCILLGKALGWRINAVERMITSSDQAFERLMSLNKYVDSFTLTVE